MVIIQNTLQLVKQYITFNALRFIRDVYRIVKRLNNSLQTTIEQKTIVRQMKVTAIAPYNIPLLFDFVIFIDGRRDNPAGLRVGCSVITYDFSVC